MAQETLEFESRRTLRKKRAQTIQHLLAAITLIVSAVSHLGGGHGQVNLLPAFELVTGSLLIGTVVRERLLKRFGKHHDRVAWVELAGVAMMFVEAVARTRGPHHLSFVILNFLVPLVFLSFVILEMRGTSLRSLKVTEQYVEVRVRLLFRRRFAFREMRSFSKRGDGIDFELAQGGKRRLNLKDVLDRETAMDWVTSRLRARGIPELPAEKLPGSESGTDEGERDQELVLGKD